MDEDFEVISAANMDDTHMELDSQGDSSER